MVASDKGHVEVVDKLLQHGARVDLQDNVRFISHHSNSLSNEKSPICYLTRTLMQWM